MADIPLEQLGLQKKWPRLAKLQEEVADLAHQAESAHAEVQRLEAALSVARNEDVAAQAQALRGGKAAPKSSREDKANRELEAARRDAAVFQRAAEDAQTELAEYRGKHGTALYHDVVQAVQGLLRQGAEHIKVAAPFYSQAWDAKYFLKDLAPAPTIDETTAARSGAIVIGIQTRAQLGRSRGEYEQMLQELVDQAPPDEEEDTDAA